MASSKMFSKICNDVGLLRRRPRISLLLVKSKKLCDKAQVECFSKLLNFANLKRFQFSSEHCTQDAATLTFLDVFSE